MNHWPLGIYRSAQGNSTSTEVLYLPTVQGPLPIAAEIDGQLYAIETDHLHTPRRLSNAQGQGVWQWITSGFGEVPASHAGNGFVLEGEGSSSGPNLGPSIDFALRYPGQVHDTETGLHYNHHRYYDPHLTVGYTQADPIGLDGGWNRFGYVDGNPTNFIDPNGLTTMWFFLENGVLIIDPETKGRAPYWTYASSGVPECECTEKDKNRGPIPRGLYRIFSSYLTKPDLLGTLARNLQGDWGGWRAPLTPTAGTEVFGRSGFFMHGGRFPGSAGCIDVGGGILGNDLTEQIRRDILGDPYGVVPVFVK